MLGIAGMAIQGYSLFEGAKQADEDAKLRKGDIALQEKALALSEKARLFKEDLAEAKVRKDLRKAQAIRLAKSAIAGTDYSSADVATSESMTASVESGLQVQRELSGMASSQAEIQSERLGIASALISAPTDLDTILGYTGAAVGFGVLATQTPEFKNYKGYTAMSPGSFNFDWDNDMRPYQGLPVTNKDIY